MLPPLMLPAGQSGKCHLCQRNTYTCINSLLMSQCPVFIQVTHELHWWLLCASLPFLMMALVFPDQSAIGNKTGQLPPVCVQVSADMRYVVLQTCLRHCTPHLLHKQVFPVLLICNMEGFLTPGDPSVKKTCSLKKQGGVHSCSQSLAG